MESYFSLLKVFRFFGLTKTAPNPSQVSYHMYIASIIYTSIIFFYFYYMFTHDIWHVGSLTGRLLDQAQLVLPLSNHLVVIFETVRWHKMDYKMISTLESIEKVAGIFLTEQTSREAIVYFTQMGFAVLACGFVAELFIIAASYKYTMAWTLTWLIRLLPNHMSRSCLMLYLFYVIYITDKFEKIHRELESTAEQAEVVKGGKSERVILKRIRTVGRLHQLVRSLQFYVEKRFGSILLFTMINYFICSTVCWYYVTSRVYYGVYFGLIESCLCTVPLLTSTVALAWGCEQYASASSSVGSALHAIRTNQPKITTLIRLISVQFQGTELTAGGFFAINFEMLKSMVFSITTYIVVFISMNQEEGQY